MPLPPIRMLSLDPTGTMLADPRRRTATDSPVDDTLLARCLAAFERISGH